MLLNQGASNFCPLIQQILTRGVEGGPVYPFTVRVPVLESTPGSACDASQFSSFREIRSILDGHDAREEGPDGIYEECERLLSPGESAALATEAAAYPEVKAAPYRDGRAPRTAADALAAARRKKPPPAREC
jgi:hypothetical protein